MLILSRRIGEKIIIDTGKEVIEVEILQSSSGFNGQRQVRLGTSAPRHVIVDRAEIYQKRMEDKKRER